MFSVLWVTAVTVPLVPGTERAISEPIQILGIASEVLWNV